MTIDDRSMEFPTELTESLRVDPVVVRTPAPAFDVAGVIRRGDRARRGRMLAGAGAAVLAVAIISVGTPILLSPGPGTPVVQPGPVVGITITPTIQPTQIPVAQCSVELLNVNIPGYVGFLPTAMDPTGRYVIGVTNATSGTPYGALLDRSTGAVTVLPVPDENVLAVSAGGTVIGNSEATDASLSYRDGHSDTLAVPNGKVASVQGVNARGDVVGFLMTRDGEGALKGPTFAVEWPADHPDQMRMISSVPQSAANTITDDGRVGGTINSRPYIWSPDGRAHALAVTWPGAEKGNVAGIVGDRAIGDVLFRGNPIATIWDLTTGVPTYYASATLILAGHLTPDGRMLAFYEPQPDNGPPDPAAALWMFMTLDGTFTRLPKPPGGSTDVNVFGISDDGRTLVGSSTGHALIWHC